MALVVTNPNKNTEKDSLPVSAQRTNVSSKKAGWRQDKEKVVGCAQKQGLAELDFGDCLSLGRDRASGIDGVSWEEYGKQLGDNLRSLVCRLKVKRYKPQPSRWVHIPKDEHSKRPLGLPALEDKIVQKGVAKILEAIYEQDFLDFSYKFRPNRSCHQAIKAVDKTIMKRPINYIIEADKEPSDS